MRKMHSFLEVMALMDHHAMAGVAFVFHQSTSLICELVLEKTYTSVECE
jgi:hypothetical protein